MLLLEYRLNIFWKPFIQCFFCVGNYQSTTIVAFYFIKLWKENQLNFLCYKTLMGI